MDYLNVMVWLYPTYFKTPKKSGNVGRASSSSGITVGLRFRRQQFRKSFATIRESLVRLDKTLVEAAENAESKIRHQLESLQAKAARAELRQSEVLDRHAKALTNGLYPNKDLQEREIAGIHFLARHGRDFLKDIYQNIHPDCFDHQILTL